MKRLNYLGLAAMAVGFAMGVSAPAQAATFDFAAEANSSGEETWDAKFGGTGWTVDDVTLQNAQGFNSVSGEVDAYFDKKSGGLDGGLGVCSNIDANNQCDPSSDDNTQLSSDFNGGEESIKLTFDKLVQITSLFLRGNDGDPTDGSNSSHEPLSNGGIKINGIEYTTDANGNVQGLPTSFASMWTFEVSDLDPHNFYLSSGTFSAIPVPAPILLLLSAIGGLGLLGRRSRQLA